MIAGMCPECGFTLGDLSDRDVVDGAVRLNFACSECGHEWTDEM